MDARMKLRDQLHLLLDASAATRAWRARLAEQVATCDLTDQEFYALWLCADDALASRGQGELATALGVSAAQMSGLVERLRKRDLLQVERLGTDRRRQTWRLTAAGANVLAAACQALLASADQFRGSLSSVEFARLHELMQRWSPGDECVNETTPDQGGPSSCAA